MNGLDLAVLVAYFLMVMAVSHWARPRRAHRDAYFLADRSLRWPVVAASIVATSISGVTFIGLPALVFAEGGDLRYLQFALAALIAKGVLGVALLPRYYAAGVGSPYEYITLKLGPRYGRAATGLFMIGAVLGQGVRVFAVALVLELLTGWSLGACIALIVGASALHTGHGGLNAVVWTDALQGLLFAGGGAFALALAVAGGAGSFEALFTAAGEAGKLRTLDFSTHPAASFTLWTGLIAMPFQNLAAYGGDQVNTQRMLACPNLSAARKALYTSLLGEGVTALFLLVGLALWAYYGTHALPPALGNAVAGNGDRIFPAFILDAIPSGARGLLIAGVFAAAMSSLDSVLSALAQVSTAGDGNRSLRAVGLWGLALGAFAWALGHGGGQLVPLAYQMTALSYPPLLGLLLLAAFAPRPCLRWPGLGALGAMGLVAALLPLTTGPAPSLAFPWLFPLGTVMFLTLTVLPKRAGPRAN